MMKTPTIQRRPQLRMDWPIWWHHHGKKMMVAKLDKQQGLLVISGSAASVRITRRVVSEDDRWFVDWEVRQSAAEQVNGRIILSTDELKAAFGLSGRSGLYGDWIIEQFGADSAAQGSYIRWEKYLNIPCPGSGHDGDPNVSIFLDTEIKNAVRELLEGAENMVQFQPQEQEFAEKLQGPLADSWDRAHAVFLNYGYAWAFDMTNVLLHAIDQGKVNEVLTRLEAHYERHLQHQHPAIRGTVRDNLLGINATEAMFLRICTQIFGLKPNPGK